VKIGLVTPTAPGPRQHGNRATAVRWTRFLRQLGHEVLQGETWGSEWCGMLIALHARRSHPSIERYAAAYPERPLVVALTGTDLYRDIRSDTSARQSLELATFLIVLQELGVKELEPRHRSKTQVIYQSAEPTRPQPLAKRYFDVCVIGNLRAEKDPFRCALAAQLLPHASRVRVTHVGSPYKEEFADEARTHMASSPRYRWLGEVPRWKARRLLSRSRLLVQTSIMEGGANVVSEALASGVPVIGSDIPGNVGMLGQDYPGYYEVGDEGALAWLLQRAETDDAFYRSLKAGCEARRYLVLPERERAALESLVKEAGEARHRGRFGGILGLWTRRRA
jgi:putative glycosyltransferase (TIGR04348 family)